MEHFCQILKWRLEEVVMVSDTHHSTTSTDDDYSIANNSIIYFPTIYKYDSQYYYLTKWDTAGIAEKVTFTHLKLWRHWASGVTWQKNRFL